MSLKLFRSTVWAHSLGPENPEDPRRSGWNPLWLALLASVWLASVGNIALWQTLSRTPGEDGPRGIAFALAFGVVIASLLMGILSLLAWRWLLKPVIVLMLLVAGAAAHFMLLYSVVIDSTMIANVLQTDLRESRDLLNLRLVVTVLVIGVLPALLVSQVRLQPLRPLAQLSRNLLAAVASLLLAGLAIFAAYQDFSSVMRNHREVRSMVNPLNTFWAIGRLTVGRRTHLSPPQPMGQDARVGARYEGRAPILLLVIGETARSDHFALNGYGRPTTPELAAAGVASWRNVRSCGTSTAASLPCMFSHLGKQAFEARSEDYENLLDVMRHAGMAVLWIDNQAGCKGQCLNVPTVSTTESKVPGLCDGGECLDEVMLQGLDQRIEQLDPKARARGTVVVLHQMGSHGPAYYKRSPPAFQKFMPQCTTNVLQQCDRQSLVNAYDNSILYTDHVLGQAIAWLRQRDAQQPGALFYVSDHGESLGENNLYLHGLPYAIAPDVQKHVPMVAWLSDSMMSATSIHMECLKGQADAALTHDHMFHSVLGLMNVSTSVYRPELDVFAPCLGR